MAVARPFDHQAQAAGTGLEAGLEGPYRGGQVEHDAGGARHRLAGADPLHHAHRRRQRERGRGTAPRQIDNQAGRVLQVDQAVLGFAVHLDLGAGPGRTAAELDGEDFGAMREVPGQGRQQGQAEQQLLKVGSPRAHGP